MLQFLLSERNGRNRKRSRERNEGWSGVEREREREREREMGRDIEGKWKKIEKKNENS